MIIRKVARFYYLSLPLPSVNVVAAVCTLSPFFRPSLIPLLHFK